MIFKNRRLFIFLLLVVLSIILVLFPKSLKTDDTIYEEIPIYSLNKEFMLHKDSTLYDVSKDRIYSIVDGLIDKKILPFGTKLIDYSYKDKVLKLNFNKSLLNVSDDMEEKMIESLVYTFTEDKKVDKIIIFIEGEKLGFLPNSKKRLDLYLDRNYGINKIYNLSNLKDVSLVNVYYYDNQNMLVPVSYISNNQDKVSIIISLMKSNIFNSSSLSSHLNEQVELINYEIKDNKMLLYFNDEIMNYVNDGSLKEEVKYAFFYSIFDTMKLEMVEFYSNDIKIDEFGLAN